MITKNSLSIVSKLDFNNVSDGVLPSSVSDNNNYSNFVWLKDGTCTLSSENGIKILNLSDNRGKIYSSDKFISNLKQENFHIELDIIISNLKTENVIIGFSNSTSDIFKISLNYLFKEAFKVTCNGRSVSTNYRFEKDVKYNIAVVKEYEKYTFYVNGLVVGFSKSSTFNNNLNVPDGSNVIIGSGGNGTANNTNSLNGFVSNFNMAYGGFVKYDTSFTKYGDKLLSRLNFGNIANTSTTSSFTCDLEAVYKSDVNWLYESSNINSINENNATLSGGTFSSNNIPNINTLFFNIKNTKNLDSIELVNFNNKYKVLYTLISDGIPDPDVIVNNYSTSALNFENDYYDNVDSTIWINEGTEIITVDNIFGKKSLKFSNLNDSIYTTNKIISGDTMPFTIEMYFKISDIQGNTNDGTDYSIFSLPNSSGKYQGIGLSKSQKVLFFYRDTSFSKPISYTSKNSKKINFNELYKLTVSYDGSTLRCFINDELDFVIGTTKGFELTNQPYRIMSYNFGSVKNTTNGIIDNFNVFDGIANKVRNYDEFENNIVLDLSCDSENGSRYFSDNGIYSEKLFNYVDLLIFADDSSILDYSSKRRTITTSGTVSLVDNTVITPIRDKKSIRTNNSRMNVSIDTIGTNDFTIEMYIANNSTTSSYPRVFQIGGNNTNGAFYIALTPSNPSHFIVQGYSSGYYGLVGDISAGMPLNKFFHLCVMRKNGIIYTFVDGVLKTQASSSYNITQNYVYMGTNNSSSEQFYGFYNSIRVSKLAIYDTKGFTLPNEQYNMGWITSTSNAKASTDKPFKEFSSLQLVDDSAYLYKKTKSYYNLKKEVDFTIKFNFNKSSDNGKNIILTNDLPSSDLIYAGDNLSYIGIGDILAEDGSANKLIIKGKINENDEIKTYLSSSTFTNNMDYEITLVNVNRSFKIYINNKLDSEHYLENDLDFSFYNNILIGGALFETNSSFIGYIKNIKIYNGVAKEPSNKNNIIELDFNGDIIDKNFNSNWVGNNITFNNVDSIKGSSAEFNGTDSLLTCSNSNSLNFSNKNFEIEYDYLIKNYDDVNNRYLMGNGIELSDGAFWKICGTTSYNSGSFNLRYNSINYGLTSSIEKINTFYNEKIFRNKDSIIGTKNGVITGILNVPSSFNSNFSNMTIGTASNLTTGVSYYKGLIDNFKSKKDHIIDDSIFGYKPAIHLPLESNIFNVGYYNSVTVSLVNSPTFVNINNEKCIKFESNKYLSFSNSNIFNLGYNNDFYIEFDFNIYSLQQAPYQNVLFSVGTSSSSEFWINVSNNTISIRLKDSSLDKSYIIENIFIDKDYWYNFKLIKSNNIIRAVCNERYVEIDRSYNFDLSTATTIGAVPHSPIYHNSLSYIKNFKMFVGTSKPNENYNDKKVLDLDFKPTNKSYLFKDNNNKFIIHPVDIQNLDFKNNLYCCKFNATSKFIELGKNELLNFGLDDFVINIKFSITSMSKDNNMILIGGGDTSGRSYIGVCGPNISELLFRNKLVISNTGGTGIFASKTSIKENQIYDIVIVRRDNTYLDLYIDGAFDSSVTNWSVTPANTIKNTQFNFNTNNNTIIGKSGAVTTQGFNGILYGIKVLRNTSDIELLHDSEEVFNTNESFTLTNGVEDYNLDYTNQNNHFIKITNDENSIGLTIDGDYLEINKDEEISNVSLFKDYEGEASDIRTYDVIINESDDPFEGSGLIDTEICEIENIDTSLINDYDNIGDYVFDGFIEGGKDIKYYIINIETNIKLLSGSEDYYYDGIDERYIDEYEIYEVDSKKSYPLYKHKMVKGYLSGNVNVANCEVESDDLEILCFRSDNKRFIGSYNVVNNSYNIDNLDVNSQYDIILSNKSKKIESKIVSNRTPLKY